jgi:hypothetical protein
MTPNKTIDTSALWWPQNLWPFEYKDLLCFLDYEPPDYQTGFSGTAYLLHAYAGGIDIRDYMSDSVVVNIEREFCYSQR